jgi:putative SOS response-associated peptidase YedK
MTYVSAMCNAYNLRHRNQAILDIARAMRLAVADLPELPPRHPIGIKQRGLILRLSGDGPLARSWARWSLVPSGAKEPPPYPLNNAMRRKIRRMAVEGRPAQGMVPCTCERLLGA